MVGVQGDRVIGHLGRMPTQLWINDQLENTSYIHDLYIHPEIRAQGAQGFFLTMRLYDAVEKASPGLCVLIWTNEINIALQQSRKYKQMWTTCYNKMLNLDSAIDKRVPKFIAYLAKPIARVAISATDALLKLFRRHPYSIECNYNHFDERFDELAKLTANTIGIAPNKNSAYLNWKYKTRPGISYQAMDKNGKLVGYIVISKSRLSNDLISISELVALNNNSQLIGALIDAAVDHARREGPARIQTVATNQQYAQALKSRLFVDREHRVPLFLAKDSESKHVELLHSPDNWHLSLGDSDGSF
jgi:hypothetical protein